MKNNYCVVKRDELFVLFEYTVGGMSSSPATFSRFLGHKQITIKAIQVPGGKTERGITVNWNPNTNAAQLLSTYFKDMTKAKTP